MTVDADTARKRLEEERARLQRLLEASEEQLRQGIDSRGSELSSFDQHPGDVATDLHEREIEESVVEDLRSQLEDVDAAVGRLEAGTYGTCGAGGHPIPDDRLEARPTARYCIEHQHEAESSAGGEEA